jgi:hypothetical protein
MIILCYILLCLAYISVYLLAIRFCPFLSFLLTLTKMHTTECQGFCSKLSRQLKDNIEIVIKTKQASLFRNVIQFLK